MNRSGNLLRNAAAFLGSRAVTNLLQFLCRTAFIYTLGKEYLGISSLYTNILTILNITELGIGTAVTYSLYEPLSRQDWSQIRSLMGFYKKAHRLVGLAVLLLGLGLMPFLPSLMTDVTDKVNIYHYYLLFLLQTVVTYWFFAYKEVLLTADQRQYVSDMISCLCRVAVTALQILSLFLWQSFLLYTVFGILNNVAKNILTAVVVDRRYPQLKDKAAPLAKDRRKNLFDGVYALALQKISTAVGTATDNLIISSFINVVAVGIYSNYYLIVNTVQSLMFGSVRRMTASLGNYFAANRVEDSRFLFTSLCRANEYLVCLCSVCFMSLLQPFITLWIGESYLLDTLMVAIIVLNFATNYLQTVVLMFREVTGLFVVGKYRSVVNAALNLVLSLALVRSYGMTGVFVGSIISRLATNWWFDAWVVCRRGLHVSPWSYYAGCGLSVAIAAACSGLIHLLCDSLGGGLLVFALRLILAVVFPSLVYLAFFGKSREFYYIMQHILVLLKRRKNK